MNQLWQYIPSDFLQNLSVLVKYNRAEIYVLSLGAAKQEDYIAVCVAIVLSLLNFIIFYFGTKKYKRYSPKEIKRKKNYKKQVREASGITRHKCAICGRTENDGEGLVFRFCSRCEGNYEYCVAYGPWGWRGYPDGCFDRFCI